MPLDPLNLTPAASLNRMPLAAPSGDELAGSTGTLAYTLLSRDAVTRQIRAHADALAIDVASEAAPDLPRLLDARLDAPEPGARHAAEQLARTFGRRLAALLLLLERGDAGSRAARPDWDDSYWAHWAAIRSVELGGGLVRGRFGERLVHAARGALAQAGSAVELRRARFAAVLPLIGAARSVPPGSRSALVFDFGQTSTKRALVRIAGGQLAELQLLPAVSTRWTPELRGQHDTTLADQQRLAQSLAELLASSWTQYAAGGQPADVELVCSLSSYVAANQPLARQGGLYGELYRVSDNLGAWLGEALSGRLARPVSVTLLHDGTAAARALAGRPQCAVITMGTALGIGFAPPIHGLLPIASDFAVG